MPVHPLAAGPDDWAMVVGAAFLAVVGRPRSGPDEELVAGLVALARDPAASLESVVSAIPLGADGAEAFAVVHLDGAADPAERSAGDRGIAVTAVVRGRAVVDVYSVGGSRRFSSSGVQPWLMAGFREVVAVELGGPERETVAVPRAGARPSVRHTGVLHGGGLQWLLLAPETTTVGSVVENAGEPLAAARNESEAATRLLPLEVRPEEDGESVFDDTIRVRRRRIEALERTTLRGRKDTAGRTQGGWQNGGEQGDREREDREQGDRATEDVEQGDGATEDVEQGDGATASPARLPPWAVRLPDGALVPVGGHPLVVGRRPAAVARTDGDAVLVTVPSPHAEISASHLRVERSGENVVITDLRSRNGTVVTPGAGAARRLRPGESIVVVGEAAVDLGDGMIVEVVLDRSRT